MLVAAGMDPKQLEAKLEGDVEKAWAEIMAEKEDVKWRHASLESRWRQAEERLHSFRMQLVAGGEDPNQGYKM